MALKNFFEFKDSLRESFKGLENSYLVNEAFRASDAEKALVLIEKYLTKKIGQIARERHPATISMKNMPAPLIGYRYYVANSERSFRINWLSSTKSMNIHSVTVWDGTSTEPSNTVTFNGLDSVVSILPVIVKMVNSPRKPVEVSDLALGDTREGDEFSNMRSEAFESEILEARSNLTPEEIALRDSIYRTPAKERTEIQRKQLVELIAKQQLKRNIAIENHMNPKEKNIAQSNEIERIKKLTEFLHSAPKEAFEELEMMTILVAKGKRPACLITGQAGVGKTYEVESALKSIGLENRKGYTLVAGKSSTSLIYEILYKNRHGLVVFDDCDSVFETEDGINLFKAALDTKKIREVSWWTKNTWDPTDMDEEEIEERIAETGKYPAYFQFTGGVIFISNLSADKFRKDKHLSAIISRALTVDIHLKPEEIRDRIVAVLPNLEKDLYPGEKGMAVKLQLLALFDELLSDGFIKTLDMRSFVKSLSIFDACNEQNFPREKTKKLVLKLGIGAYV